MAKEGSAALVYRLLGTWSADGQGRDWARDGLAGVKKNKPMKESTKIFSMEEHRIMTS